MVYYTPPRRAAFRGRRVRPFASTISAQPLAGPAPPTAHPFHAARPVRCRWERRMEMRHLEATDPEIAAIIRREERRQFEGIELIASENYISAAVAETM